ncbi:MAG: MFS transporter, partial [Alphaproteobacteria bacterium]|nr:MFS transporter [Alphaproteobacteria bacterium]
MTPKNATPKTENNHLTKDSVITMDGTKSNSDQDAQNAALIAPQDRRLAFIAVILATAVCVVDASIVNIALPTIAKSLNTTPAESVWVVSSYQIVSAMFLLPLAALGDAIGRRRIYLFGLALFVAASLACAIAPNLLILTLARAVQGLGGAAVMSLNMALMRTIYPPKQLGQAIGGIMLSVSISAAVAPTLASLILSVSSWPFLFLINLPVGGLALWLGYGRLREPKQDRREFDKLSAISSAVAIGFLVMALEQSGQSDNLWQIIALSGIGIAAMAILITRQTKLSLPFLPIRMLTTRGVMPVMNASFFAFIGQSAVMVAAPFLLEHELGRNPIETGLLLTPWPVFLGLASMAAGRLAGRYSMRSLVTLGYGLMAVAMLAILLLPNNAQNLDIIWRMTLCGIGFGLSQTPANRTIMSLVPHESSGIVGGLNAAARLLGQAIGAASVALMFAHFADHTGWVTGPRMGLLLG